MRLNTLVRAAFTIRGYRAAKAESQPSRPRTEKMLMIEVLVSSGTEADRKTRLLQP